jgi:hypothetical protein
VNLIEEREEEYRAVNILTAIEHMNAGILKGQEASFIEIYNVLSEIAHPNHWGILGLYGNHIEAEKRIEFGNKHRKDDLWWMIGPALCVVWMVNDLAEEFEKKLLPAMARVGGEISHPSILCGGIVLGACESVLVTRVVRDEGTPLAYQCF